jgi:Protein of unknown function (DUF3313)
MQMRQITQLIMIATCLTSSGCAARRAARTGFLSDYSDLEAQSEVSYRYVAPGRLEEYSKFIIDPVTIHLHRRSKAKKKVSEQDLTDLKNYMHTALVEAIEDEYEVVYRPGPGVARARVALTDIKKAQVLLNIHPASKIMGAGLGGASLEAELVDSQTNEQIAALVESQLGNRLSLDGLSTWGDAKAIMDDWAGRFRARLDEAHAR